MKFEVVKPKHNKKITETFVLKLTFSHYDTVNKLYSIIHIPKEKMDCEFLQHGLKILYTTYHTNTYTRWEADHYYRVKGFFWIAMDMEYCEDDFEYYEPNIKCDSVGCKNNKHYELFINYPDVPERHNNDKCYKLENIDLKYYDLDGNICNVNTVFEKEDNEEICEMIENTYKRNNKYKDKEQYFDKEYFPEHFLQEYKDKIKTYYK